MDVYVASTSCVTSLVLIFILSGSFVFKFLLPLVPYVLLWETGRSRRILGRRTAISTTERVVACPEGRGVTILEGRNAKRAVLRLASKVGVGKTS